MKYYLGITASVKGFEICLWDNHFHLLGSYYNEEEYFHRIGLDSMSELLKHNNMTMDKLHGIVVDTGPASSFTGVRLALAMAKTIAYIHSITLYEVSSLALFLSEAVEYNYALRSCLNVVLLQGHQNRFFVGVFDGLNLLGEIKDVSFEKVVSTIEENITLINAQIIALIGNQLELFSREELQKISHLKHFVPLSIPKMIFCHQDKITAVDFKDFLPKYYRKTQAEEEIAPC